MHYFDPTMDWPMDLLPSGVPDLLVVRSHNLHDGGAPWNGVGGQNCWSTGWIQYASADGEQGFIIMTFFNQAAVTEDDKHQFDRYSDHLRTTDVVVRRYGSTSGADSFSTLASGTSYHTRQAERLT